MLQEKALEVILIQAAARETPHVRPEVLLEALLTLEAQNTGLPRFTQDISPCFPCLLSKNNRSFHAFSSPSKLLPHEPLQVEQHHLPLHVGDAAKSIVGVNALELRAELRELVARAEERHVLRQPQAVVADQQLLVVLKGQGEDAKIYAKIYI